MLADGLAMNSGQFGKLGAFESGGINVKNTFLHLDDSAQRDELDVGGCPGWRRLESEPAPANARFSATRTSPVYLSFERPRPANSQDCAEIGGMGPKKIESNRSRPAEAESNGCVDTGGGLRREIATLQAQTLDDLEAFETEEWRLQRSSFSTTSCNARRPLQTQTLDELGDFEMTEEWGRQLSSLSTSSCTAPRPRLRRRRTNVGPIRAHTLETVELPEAQDWKRQILSLANRHAAGIQQQRSGLQVRSVDDFGPVADWSRHESCLSVTSCEGGGLQRQLSAARCQTLDDFEVPVALPQSRLQTSRLSAANCEGAGFRRQVNALRASTLDNLPESLDWGREISSLSAGGGPPKQFGRQGSCLSVASCEGSGLQRQVKALRASTLDDIDLPDSLDWGREISSLSAGGGLPKEFGRQESCLSVASCEGSGFRRQVNALRAPTLDDIDLPDSLDWGREISSLSTGGGFCRQTTEQFWPTYTFNGGGFIPAKVDADTSIIKPEESQDDVQQKAVPVAPSSVPMISPTMGMASIHHNTGNADEGLETGATVQPKKISKARRKGKSLITIAQQVQEKTRQSHRRREQLQSRVQEQLAELTHAAQEKELQKMRHEQQQQQMKLRMHQVLAAYMQTDDAAAGALKFCPYCGNEVLPHFKFCRFCGNLVEHVRAMC